MELSERAESSISTTVLTQIRKPKVAVSLGLWVFGLYAVLFASGLTVSPGKVLIILDIRGGHAGERDRFPRVRSGISPLDPVLSVPGAGKRPFGPGGDLPGHVGTAQHVLLHGPGSVGELGRVGVPARFLP